MVNLGRLVGDMADLLNRALGEGVEVETVIAGGLWNTLADPAQVESAVLNLAIHARDAMPGGGKLTIELTNAALDPFAKIPEFKYCAIRVTLGGEVGSQGS